MTKISFTGLLLLHTLLLTAQTPQQRVRQYWQKDQTQLIAEYRTCLRIPNVSADSANIQKDTGVIVQMMQQRGIPTQLIDGPATDKSPAVFGEITTRSHQNPDFLRPLRRTARKSEAVDGQAGTLRSGLCYGPR